MTVQDNLARGERQQFFDVVKAFCIILVILTHCAYPKGFSAQVHFPLWIDTAVPFFMIISGYFGAQSLKNATTLGEAYSFEGILKKLARYTIPFADDFTIWGAIKGLFVKYAPSALPYRDKTKSMAESISAMFFIFSVIMLLCAREALSSVLPACSDSENPNS